MKQGEKMKQGETILCGQRMVSPCTPFQESRIRPVRKKQMLHESQAVRSLRRNPWVSKRRHEIYLSGTGQRSAGRAEVFVCI